MTIVPAPGKNSPHTEAENAVRGEKGRPRMPDKPLESSLLAFETKAEKRLRRPSKVGGAKANQQVREKGAERHCPWRRLPAS